ncbi:MAG: purine-binding chemotaxis protein CheW [Paracoccaceae bacterium]|jgi:chemotaxis signal transduction protein
MVADSVGIYGAMRVGDALLGVAIEHLAEVCPVGPLSPLMIRRTGLLGSLDLRGTLVPIMDPAVLCGIGQASTPPHFAAILKFEGRLLGIGIDAIFGLSQVSKNAVQPLDTSPNSLAQSVVEGGFLQGKDIITVIDVPKIFNSAATPSVTARDANAQDAHNDPRQPMLTFDVGEATFSVAAIEVHGTVPRQVIDRNSLTSGFCLGTITHHGRRIPVMATTSVLGLGHRTHHECAEIVVLRFPDDHLLGFAVDAIRKIISIDPAQLKKAPAALSGRSNLLSHVLIGTDADQIFNISIDALRLEPMCRELAEMSSKTEEIQATSSIPPDQLTGGNTVHERVRYLVYDAGGLVATPVTQVIRIVEPPKTVVPAPGAGHGIQGLFAQDGFTVPLVNLSQVLGGAQSPEGHQRVLLVGTSEDQVGFDVSSVHSIETSAWRFSGKGINDDHEAVVMLGLGAEQRALPIVDLEQLSATTLGL